MNTQNEYFEYLYQKFGIKHSIKWIKQLLELCEETPFKHIDILYGQQIGELRIRGVRRVWNKYKTACLSDSDFPNDIVQDAFLYFRNHFDGYKGIEWAYYDTCIDKFALEEIARKKLYTVLSEIPMESSVPEMQSEEILDSKTRKGLATLRDNYIKKTIHCYGAIAGEKLLYSNILNNNTNFSVDFDGLMSRAKSQPLISYIDLIKNQSVIKTPNPSTQFIKERIAALKPDRIFMEDCVNILRRGIADFRDVIKHPREELKKFQPQDIYSIPMLSAIAVDANGIKIGECYKGEGREVNRQGKTRSFELHCEYTLLELIIKSKEERKRLKGGKLYVTLEPCNKRKYYCLNPNCDETCNHDEAIPKIPCAVRCLESGIRNIYISNADTDPTVLNKGVFILKTGSYPIELTKSKDYVLYDKTTNQKIKEEKGLSLLEEYFLPKYGHGEIFTKDEFRKKYSKVDLHPETEYIKIYKISEPVEVLPFDKDLTEEIIKLNAPFLQHKNDTFFLPR